MTDTIVRWECPECGATSAARIGFHRTWFHAYGPACSGVSEEHIYSDLTALLNDETIMVRAAEAVAAQHQEEIMASMRGDIPLNQWRPREYAHAVLKSLATSVKVAHEPDHRQAP